MARPAPPDGPQPPHRTPIAFNSRRLIRSRLHRPAPRGPWLLGAWKTAGPGFLRTDQRAHSRGCSVISMLDGYRNKLERRAAKDSSSNQPLTVPSPISLEAMFAGWAAERDFQPRAGKPPPAPRSKLRGRYFGDRPAVHSLRPDDWLGKTPARVEGRPGFTSFARRPA